MKKTLFIIIATIGIISFSSCNHNAQDQHLLEMRDSIQAEYDWCSEMIEEQFQYMDSLFEVDRELYLAMHDFCMGSIHVLQEKQEKEEERLFKIDMELGKKH